MTSAALRTHLPRLHFLHRDRSSFTARYAALVANLGLHNAFNPSFCSLGDRHFLAIRHMPPSGRPPFVARVVESDDLGRAVTDWDLSEHAASHGAPVVADPKLLRLGQELWVTFNDGWSATGNRLLLMRLTPSMGVPMACHFEGRRTVEKNWSFFLRGDELCAVYSLCPLRILRARWPVTGAADVIEFSPRPGEGLASSGAEPLSIGPQATATGDCLYTVAHEKWHWRGKRAYLGRWVRIDLSAPQARTWVSPIRLAHSPLALLGSRIKHNQNLISCTYFSGLSVHGSRVRLGYGINDTTCGFAELDMEAL